MGNKNSTSIEELKRIASNIIGNLDWKVVYYKKELNEKQEKFLGLANLVANHIGSNPYKMEREESFDKLDDKEKSIAIKKICKGKYNKEEIVYLKTTNDFKSGWAFTKDSFCYSGNLGNGIIKYRDINQVNDVMGCGQSNGLNITCKNNQQIHIDGWEEGKEVLIGFNFNFMEKIRDYLNVVKDF
ncbi:MAG: hypothetical protein IJ862_05580 [Selenomonadaceae bacterium]|nr:hypothetical protein [Selenomonadaceae bacterium]